MTDEYDKPANELIMRYVGEKTPEEIAELTGLTPEEVLTRKNTLLESVDVLTIEQQRQRLIMRLNGIARKAEEKADSTTDDRNVSGLLNTAVNAIDKLLKQIAQMGRENKSDIESLNRLRVMELLRLFDVIIAKGVAEVSLRYEIDADELTETFQSYIVEAAKELDN